MPSTLIVRDEQSAVDSSRLLRMPPQLTRGMGRVAAALIVAQLPGGREEDVIDELAEALKAHPEGTLFYLRGELLVAKGNFPDAEKDFRAAAQTPALLPVRRPALYNAAFSAGIGSRKKLAPADPAAQQRAIAYTRQFLELGPLRPGEPGYLASITFRAREFDLARNILTQWERLDPDNLEVTLRRAEVELAAEGYPQALKAADSVLARKADDARALQFRARALGHLRELAKAADKTP
jgi:tetratricopeptide (TPR) repeat protein